MSSGKYDKHRQLVEACKAGSRIAHNELYSEYAKSMYNICYRMMNNAEDARDMLQEGFIEAFTHLSLFRFESTFGAWLKKIMINRCINAVKKKRQMSMVDEDPPDLAAADEVVDEEKLRLDVARVKRAMDQLPHGARIIFSLYLIEGYDHSEIAEIMQISESTSKTQFMRARQMVKDILLGMPDFSI